MSIIFLRTVILYCLVIFTLRIMGKRQLGQLQPSEFVVAIMISNLATFAIEEANVPLLVGVIPIMTLMCFEVFNSGLALKSRLFRRMVSGSARIVIRDGCIDQGELTRLRFSIDDLYEQLRQKDVFDITEVALGLVETNGQLSVYKKYLSQAATNGTMNLPDEKGKDFPPVILISDGELIRPSLDLCNLSGKWLEKVLAEKSLRTDDVFLMVSNKSADYQIFTKDRRG